MTYYAIITDNKLNGKGQCPVSGENTFSVEIAQEVYNDFDRYMWDGVDVIVNPDYEEEQRQKEQERINQLTMTALDFINFLRQAGLTLEQIRAYLDANIELDTQLKYCQNVYCGVVLGILPITVGDITITADMVELAFRIKNGEVAE